MTKRKFEIQWSDFIFIAHSAGGANAVTVRDKMKKAGVLKMLGKGRFEIKAPKSPVKRRKLEKKIAGGLK